MKKLIPILFALVLILVLLPAPEARAVYSDGDPCPGCGSTVTFWMQMPDGHYFYCPTCLWQTQWEPHTNTATCTEADKCPICLLTMHALGHDLVHHNAQPATCTEGGNEAYDTCNRCEYTTYKAIPALGHNLGEWVVNPDKKPTCTEAGQEIARCTRCDYLETRDVPALGHKPGKAVKENVKEADCTHDGGYDEVTYCTICGKEVSRKTVTVEATGHDWQPYEYHVTLTRFYYICKNCGRTQWIHNKDSMNMKPGLVRYANGDAVDYRASATGPDRDGVLTIMPIKHSERDSTDDISLYMTPDDVYVWVWEKMNRIELVRDGVTLALDPREITPEMFGLKEDEQPDFYVFTLTPSGKDGWLVRAEALIGEKRIPAEELKGFTLTAAGKETAITANGVYAGE